MQAGAVWVSRGTRGPQDKLMVVRMQDPKPSPLRVRKSGENEGWGHEKDRVKDKFHFCLWPRPSIQILVCPRAGKQACCVGRELNLDCGKRIKDKWEKGRRGPSNPASEAPGQHTVGPHRGPLGALTTWMDRIGGGREDPRTGYRHQDGGLRQCNPL